MRYSTNSHGSAGVEFTIEVGTTAIPDRQQLRGSKGSKQVPFLSKQQTLICRRVVEEGAVLLTPH